MRAFWQIVEAFNPVELWRAWREAEDGVCLMAMPAVVRIDQRRQHHRSGRR